MFLGQREEVFAGGDFFNGTEPLSIADDACFIDKEDALFNGR